MSRVQLIFSLNETKGVLVITPVGDAISYRDIDVATAVTAVLDSINQLADPRVVVDLSGSRYFGSIMIGERCPRIARLASTLLAPLE